MGVNIEALAKKKPLAQTTQEVLTGAPEGTRTPDPLLRRQMLYPAELQAPVRSMPEVVLPKRKGTGRPASQRVAGPNGAGDGNRTHTTSLEGWGSTTELHPHVSRR